MHILFDLARYQLLSVFISERFHLTTKYYHGNYRKGLNAVVLASNTLLLSCVNCVQGVVCSVEVERWSSITNFFTFTLNHLVETLVKRFQISR